MNIFILTKEEKLKIIRFMEDLPDKEIYDNLDIDCFLTMLDFYLSEIWFPKNNSIDYSDLSKKEILKIIKKLLSEGKKHRAIGFMEGILKIPSNGYIFKKPSLIFKDIISVIFNPFGL